jgi:peptidoglycan-associated lipoprotein
VAAIRPGTVAPNAQTEARVFGSGFVAGSAVSFGLTPSVKTVMENENTLVVTVPALANGVYDVKVTNPDGKSTMLRGGLTVSDASALAALEECRHVRVYFGLDDAALGAEAKALLSSKTACYQGTPAPVVVEGHCDERGTTDYNIALGQRRADGVKRHLQTMGVSPGRVSSVSYGEERPLDAGRDESAWSKNRRAEIKLRE